MRVITKTFDNADYYKCNICDEDISHHDFTGTKHLCGNDDITAIHSELLYSDRHGQYIPKCFYDDFKNCPEKWNLTQDEIDALQNPDDEWYWEAWEQVCNNAKFKDDDGHVWYINQDGDCFAICFINKGVEK